MWGKVLFSLGKFKKYHGNVLLQILPSRKGLRLRGGPLAQQPRYGGGGGGRRERPAPSPGQHRRHGGLPRRLPARPAPGVVPAPGPVGADAARGVCHPDHGGLSPSGDPGQAGQSGGGANAAQAPASRGLSTFLL